LPLSEMYKANLEKMLSIWIFTITFIVYSYIQLIDSPIAGPDQYYSFVQQTECYENSRTKQNMLYLFHGMFCCHKRPDDNQGYWYQ
jgi:hypothetical protein